jgi:RNA polymerase sigma-70 factor (ECF subfamily)
VVIRRQRLLRDIGAVYSERYSAFVRVARAITGDPEGALDAVQEGFASAIRSRHTFRAEGSLEAWLWRCVVNASRKASRTRLEEIDNVDPVAAPPLPSSALAPLISRLPERQRLVVFLRYYADMDYRSIAACLEIQVGTVSATLAAAHRSIRLALQEVSARDRH